MMNTETTSVKNPVMTLITKSQMKKLKSVPYTNMKPIIKLFGGPITWLLTHIADNGVVFGYGDIGQGIVEWGSLCHVSELPTLRAGIGFLERDRYWEHKDGVNYLDMHSLV